MLTQPSGNIAVATSAAVENPTQATNASDATGLPKRQILAIDDERDGLECLCRFFEIAGFQVAAASSADEALVRIREKSPDLIITDEQMPDMTGTELCKCLRSDPQMCEIPVILYSAIPLLDTDTWMFDRTITKPTDLKDLLAVARELL